jgi:hypothetical protein
MENLILSRLLTGLGVAAALSVTTLPALGASFIDSFDDAHPYTLSETGNMDDSLDQNWWLNSGAQLQRRDGVAASVQGELASTDRFRLLYAISNPIDTDNGYRPQNILRLVTRTQFKNFTQQVFFNINQINTSTSPNRNQSNGVFFFNRYQDGNNLYYVGIRVDGSAVIKKKYQGQYYTLKSVIVYPGHYDRNTLPNLLPIHRWIGIRTVIANNANNHVDIAMYVNDNQLGSGWIQVLKLEDTGADADLIMKEGYAGIRSDFMDVSFDSYAAIESQN